MKVLFVASECAPLVKTGGLADVVGALPKALAAAGLEVRILLPGYREVMAWLARQAEQPVEVATFGDLFGQAGRVLAIRGAGLDVLVLDAPGYFDRDGPIYVGFDGDDWPDNPFRFGSLAWVAAAIAQNGLSDGWGPDLIHAHDWQTGLIPIFLEQQGVAQVPVVFTIHNILYQGRFPAASRQGLDLPEAGFTSEGYEFYGQINFMKAALVGASAVTTVSPTYARELESPAFGNGLEGVLAARAADGDPLVGILNGIDPEVWDPASDPAVAPFDVKHLAARATGKQALTAEFGLKLDRTAPLFGVVSRLTDQKGLDLLLAEVPRLVAAGGGLVLLGSGDATLEAAFQKAAAEYPDRIGVRIGYDEGLAHRIYAGADVIAVPSRFEPCGLTQMYAMRYGALPLVARTGGLADSVIDANDAALRAGVATGFQMEPDSQAAFGSALERVFALYRDRKAWRGMQRNAMRHPVGWDKAAGAYVDLYNGLLGVG